MKLQRSIGMLACFVMGGLNAASAELPAIPGSNRVISQVEVKNFWINKIRKAPMNSRPLGLEPEKQRKWDAHLAERKDTIAAIRQGNYDHLARLAQLKHNAEAWKQLGDLEKSEQANQQLMDLEVHLAQLAKLKAEKKRAEEESKTAEASREHMQSLEAEIVALRQQITNCCD